MSCYIILNDIHAWTRTNEVYQAVLSCMCEELLRSSPGDDLSGKLCGEAGEARWPEVTGLDLRKLSTREMGLLTKAARASYERVRERFIGGEGGAAGEGKFVDDFGLLVEMLEHPPTVKQMSGKASA